MYDHRNHRCYKKVREVGWNLGVKLYHTLILLNLTLTIRQIKIMNIYRIEPTGAPTAVTSEPFRTFQLAAATVDVVFSNKGS